jgi:hypothetical protein
MWGVLEGLELGALPPATVVLGPGWPTVAVTDEDV